MPHKNHKDFEWTSKLAYVVGLVTTDGSLSSDGRHIDFTSKDSQLLETFKDCLGLKVKIGYKTSGSSDKLYPRLQFGNVAFYRWLTKIGLMPNKTKYLRRLDIPDEFFFDFLRGHLDGDGSIRVFMDPIFHNSQRIYTIFLSAKKEHLDWISQTTQRLLDIHGFIRKGTRVWILTYAKKESLLLLPKIYYSENIPCLKRKRILLEKIKASCRSGGIGTRVRFRAV